MLLSQKTIFGKIIMLKSIVFKVISLFLPVLKFTPLLNEGDYEKIKTFINKHPQIFKNVRKEEILLMGIRQLKPIQVIKSLVDSNVDFYQKSIYLETPLMIAAYYNRLDVAEILVEKYNDIYNIDDRGNTALHHAMGYESNAIDLQFLYNAEIGDSAAMVMFLLNKGLDPHIPNLQNKTALDLAMNLKCNKSLKAIQAYEFNKSLKGALEIKERTKQQLIKI